MKVDLKVYDGNGQNYGKTLKILDNAGTPPHNAATSVFIECEGRRYEARILTYRKSDTLRGAGTIKTLICDKHWHPGRILHGELTVNGGTHIYKVL